MSVKDIGQKSRSKNVSMGISIECILEMIDDFTYGAAEELTVRNGMWGVFEAYAVPLITIPISQDQLKRILLSMGFSF